MIKIQRVVTSSIIKSLWLMPIVLLLALSHTLRAQTGEGNNNKNIYAVVRADANREMLSMIRQSLVREGFDAEFTKLKYNGKGQLTDIRMVIKQGDFIIGEVSNVNEQLKQPLVFYFIDGKTKGLSRGYPKDLPEGDRRKINNLHGFMMTDGSHLEIHGKYKSGNMEVNGKYISKN